MVAGVRGRMDEDASKPFSEPVTITLGGSVVAVQSTRQAFDLLSGVDWPGARDAAHRDACETCLKVFDGHRSTVDARTRFIEAADEAGLLVRRAD